MGHRRIRTPQDLGAALRDGRRARALTQAELARAAGVSREWLIGVEQGHRPRAELEKILAVLAALELPLTVGVTSPREATEHPSDDATAITDRVTREAIAALRNAPTAPVLAERGQPAARLLDAGVDPELVAHLTRNSSATIPASHSPAAENATEEGELS